MNHSIDKEKATVYNTYIPAAEQGNYEAAKKCGKYFSLVDELDNAIKYYELYLDLVPFPDMYAKIELKTLKAKRVKRGLFG